MRGLCPLAFGAAPLGNLYREISDADANGAIAAALENGIRYFDVAPQYGRGLAEQRLGDALSTHAPGIDVAISTKVGFRLVPSSIPNAQSIFKSNTHLRAEHDYSFSGTLQSFEDSCSRLKRSSVDIVYVHDLGRRTHGDKHHQRMKEFLDGSYPALAELRRKGAVGAIGLGVNEWEVCEEVLQQVELDVILLAGRYTLLEQGALDSFLPLCARRGVRVVVGGPFNSGILATGVRSASRPPYYDYRPATADVTGKVAAIEDICNAHDVPLAAAALQFPLGHPQVECVLPGLASADEVHTAAGHMRVEIPGSLWAELKKVGLLREDAPAPSGHSRKNVI